MKLKIGQSRIEADFEYFVRALPALEPVEFCGLAKILGVEMTRPELIDFDHATFEQLKDDEAMQAKITEHFVKLTPETSVEGFFADDEKGFFWESDGAGKNRFIKVPDGFYDFVFKMYQD